MPVVTLNCLLHRINYLPYYLPIVIEALKYSNQKQETQVNFFLEKAPLGKDFIDPFYPKHLKEIMSYSKRYGFKVFPLTESNLELLDGRKDSSKVVYLVGEGNIVGIKDKNKVPEWYSWIDRSFKSKLVSLVINFEFAIFLDKYIGYVDYVIFPSQTYIDYYFPSNNPINNNIKKKFIALGSPKYDFLLQEKEKTQKPLELLHHKYSLSEFQDELEPHLRDKYILIVFPKDPQKHKKSNTLYPKFDDLIKLYQILRKLGYKIIVKNRFQDSLFNNKNINKNINQESLINALKGDYYIEDIDYQVVNSMELIRICEIGIFFSSSISEEFVALGKPYIDLKVDLSKDRFPFYNQEHNSRVIPYNVLFSKKDIQIEEILQITIKQLVKNMNQEHNFPEKDDLLTLSSGSSERILNKFLL